MKESSEILIKIGCSGFYNRHWRKLFYPGELPQSKWLNFYCEHFNTLEINSTFYHFPTIYAMQGWNDKSPDGFSFSIKAPKTITHIKKLEDCEKLLTDFYAVCKQGLKKKLGCILFQFPRSFQFSQERLKLIIGSLNPSFKNVVEFRHQSWWMENVYNELGKSRISFCSINHPSLPAEIITNTTTAYVRLHGNPKLFYSEYTEEQLQNLYQSLTEKTKLKEAYIYFNNTAGDAGIINARQMQQMAR